MKNWLQRHGAYLNPFQRECLTIHKMAGLPPPKDYRKIARKYRKLKRRFEKQTCMKTATCSNWMIYEMVYEGVVRWKRRNQQKIIFRMRYRRMDH